MEFLRLFFPNTGVEAVLDLIFTNNFFLLIIDSGLQASLQILVMSNEFIGVLRAAVGIDDGLIRLSVGLENSEDLIADLDQALQVS